MEDKLEISSCSFITERYGIGKSTLGDINRIKSKLEKENKRYGHAES